MPELVQVGAGDLAREQLSGLPPQVQLALADFMDAVVIVDPAEYELAAW